MLSTSNTFTEARGNFDWGKGDTPSPPRPGTSRPSTRGALSSRRSSAASRTPTSTSRSHPSSTRRRSSRSRPPSRPRARPPRRRPPSRPPRPSTPSWCRPDAWEAACYARPAIPMAPRRTVGHAACASTLCISRAAQRGGSRSDSISSLGEGVELTSKCCLCSAQLFSCAQTTRAERWPSVPYSNLLSRRATGIFM